MTLPKERLTKIFKTAGQAAKGTEYASVAGINMEGPFIDEAKKGAHKREYIIAPDSEFFSQCMEASENMIKLVTLAPNVEGADDFIREWKDKVVISVGHTSAVVMIPDLIKIFLKRRESMRCSRERYLKKDTRFWWDSGAA